MVINKIWKSSAKILQLWDPHKIIMQNYKFKNNICHNKKVIKGKVIFQLKIILIIILIKLVVIKKVFNK